MTGFLMPVYVGKSTTDSHPKPVTPITSLPVLADLLRCNAGRPKGEWYWIPVDLRNGHRKANMVERVYALVIDIDEGLTLAEGRAIAEGRGYQCIVYTSASHQKQKDDKPPCDRYRLVFPLERPVKGDCWSYLYGPLCEFVLGREGVHDVAMSDPSRLWYGPQDAEYVFEFHADGPTLPPSAARPKPKDPPRPIRPQGAMATDGQAMRDRPGDDFEQRKSWSDLLGWIDCKFLRANGEEEYWQRPGKEGDRPSVTVNYRGSGLLYVFSSSMSPLEANKTYTKFGFYACIKHGDNAPQSMREAARELGREGYGKR